MEFWMATQINPAYTSGEVCSGDPRDLKGQRPTSPSIYEEEKENEITHPSSIYQCIISDTSISI